MLAHYAVRWLMHNAATQGRKSPLDLSLTENIHLFRRAQPQSGASPPSETAKTKTVVRATIAKRGRAQSRQRSNPRMVKRRGTAFASHQRGLKLHQSIDLAIACWSRQNLCRPRGANQKIFHRTVLGFAPEKAKALWDRFEFVYTPKHGSWLNMAEIEINVMVGQCLDRRIDSIETVRSETAA